MRMTRHLLAVVATSLSIAAGSDVLFAQATPATPARLTGQAAMNALIGNTAVVTGAQSGKDITYYFMPDGTMKGMATGGNYIGKGKWRLEVEKLCMSEQDGRSPFCLTFSVSSDSVLFTDPDGKTATGTILKGNARNM